MSILHRRDLVRDGRAPLLLYGYGSYGMSMPASFSANRLSLVDRGFVYAIAHIRGGSDRGWSWYLDGKREKKTNTFDDFVAAGRALIETGYTSAGRIVGHGGSAGGMLMGAVANRAPELFAGIIAEVPFVDVLATMLDETLPLTRRNGRMGNPITDAAAFNHIRSYSPYDNVTAQRYPAILAMAGLTDPRVTYWEPAKWVARLRATMTGGGPIILHTNMGAGHGGASGRFSRWTKWRSPMPSPWIRSDLREPGHEDMHRLSPERAVQRGDVPGRRGGRDRWKRHDLRRRLRQGGVGQEADMTPDTVVWIASMTKAVTGAVAMQQVERGALKLDAPAKDVIPYLGEVRVLEGFDKEGRPRLRKPVRDITLRHC